MYGNRLCILALHLFGKEVSLCFFFFKCQMTWPKKILITLRSTCMYVPRVRRGVEFGGDIIPCMMAIGFNLT